MNMNDEKQAVNIVSPGGQAFPMWHRFRGELHLMPGMSLRDYFAGQALPAALAAQASAATANLLSQRDGSESMAASLAYNISDAMLAERSKSA